MSRRSRWSLILVVLLGFAAVISGGLYIYIRSGGLRARQKPSGLETRIARWAVNTSVPDSAKSMPLPPSMKGSSSDLAHHIILPQRLDAIRSKWVLIIPRHLRFNSSHERRAG